MTYKWFKLTDAAGIGTIRHRLYIDGKETPYFIDEVPASVKHHRHHADYKYTLWAAGQGSYVKTRDGGGYRIAAFQSVSNKLVDIKAIAESKGAQWLQLVTFQRTPENQQTR